MGSPLDVLLPDSSTTQKANPLDELLITPSGPVASSQGKGALAGYAQGPIDFLKNLGGVAQSAAHMIQNPDEIGQAISGGGEAIGHAVTHIPETVKGIFWDGLIKPVVWNNVRLAYDTSLTEEDRYNLARESSLAMTGLALGEGVGRVIGGLGKGAEAASKLKLLTNAKNVEQMVDVVGNTLTPQQALQASVLAAAKLKGESYFKSALRTAPIGAGSGFAMGVAQSNDPNEAFKQGIINGMVGAFLGPVFHSVAGGGKKGYQLIRDTGLERARDDMYGTLLRESPDLTLEQTLTGVNFVKVGADNLPAGQVFVFHNIPDEMKLEDLPANAEVRMNKNGKRSVLVMGSAKRAVSDLTPEIKADAGLMSSENDSRAALGYAFQHGKFKAVDENTMQIAKEEFTAETAKWTRKLAQVIRLPENTTAASTFESIFGSDINLHSRDEAIRFVQNKLAETKSELERFGRQHERFKTSQQVPDNTLLVQNWKETGFVPNQLISFKGVDHQFLRVDKGFAIIRDLTSGREHRTSLKNLEPNSGRVFQVDYKPAEEILLGKRFADPAKPGRFAVLSKNTKSVSQGEMPWRVSFFRTNADGLDAGAYGHIDFMTPEEGIKFATTQPGSIGWANHMFFEGTKKPINNAQNLWQGFSEVDSKSKLLPASFRSAETPLEVKPFAQIDRSELVKALAAHPDELAAYNKNVESEVNKQMEDASKISESLASYGVLAGREQDGKLSLRNADGTKIGDFNSVTDLYNHARTLTGNGGDLVPPVGSVRGIGFDDQASFAMNQNRNFVNALRDWFGTRASWVTTPYSWATALENTTGRRFFNDFFLPLQHARTAYNIFGAKLAEYINPLLGSIAKLDPERKRHISNAIETFSPEQMLSDKPSILARALSEKEKRIGQELAANSTHDDRVTAYQYHRQAQALLESLKGASKAEAARLAADFKQSVTDKLTPVQAQVIKIMHDIRGENMDEIGVYAVNRLADAIESKSISREDYMNVNKFSAEERDIVDKIEKAYDLLADEFKIDPARRLGGYITHAVEYDGKVLDGSVIANSRYLTSQARDFVYNMVRTGEMQDLIRDPGELLKKYVIQGSKSEHLYPALSKAQQWLQTAMVGMNKGQAEAVYRRAKDYMNQIAGQMDPTDALVTADVVEKASGAFIQTLQRLGINDGTTDKWLKNYLKVSELATQGFKPIAGLRDATSVMMYIYARFDAKRLGNIMSEWNNALETKGILQEQGKIPGLNLEFFTGIDGALKNQTFLDKMAEGGFKFSGQPFVYQQFHAMVYLNTLKNTMRNAADFEAKKITQAQFERRIGLETYDKPVVKEFVSKLKDQPIEAAKYLADITGREVVGYYGMANHPFFMSGKMGKVLGQHGQWPLWMLQNFGRLASQGTRGQRIATAAKIAAMFGAVTYGGRAAGFNLGSWTFSPDNAIFLPGVSSPVGQTATWTSLYFATNDPSQKEFYSYMLQRQTNLARSQYYLPMPGQFYNIGWGLARANAGDPLWIIGGQMLGIPIDQSQYPKR